MDNRFRGACRAETKCGARRSGVTSRVSPPPCLPRLGATRERRTGPVDLRARSRLCAAAARAGKKTTLFPLRPPPRIMYQDYPGNFDTSSRGSSGSPAHAESYSSGGGGQQVRAGPVHLAAPADSYAPFAPTTSTPNLRLFPFLARLGKYLGVCGVLFCPAPPTPPLFFF